MNNFNDYDFIDDEFWDEDFSRDDIEKDQVVYYPKRDGYWCYNCEKRFEYPIVKRTTQGRMFGVSFYDEPTVEELLCPFCKSDEIEKEKEDEE